MGSSDRPSILGRSVPAEVSIYEVGPRDGLQNESAVVPTEGKLKLIGALADAGLKRIEVTSFVSPKWIPPLADSREVASSLEARPGVVWSALVPNAKGLEGAVAARMEEVAVFMSASETHNKKNINKTIEETFAAFAEVIGPARDAGMRVRGYVSVVWGCPYEGAVDPLRAREVADTLLQMGCYQVSLGDTIGVGTPGQTERIMGAMLEEIPAEKLALHFHDTRGTALANALVGLAYGITTLDASVGGLGGCPYAPGASGNLATEDLVYMLDGLGVRHGVDLEKLVAAGELAQELVGHELPGRYLKAHLGARLKKGSA
ncbi:hydroxymethylglutaryl-CoA lyase [Vulgatibacter incomptus]|uniref:Hydroxymethylglutaryl-CoA lyase n=1 Tax=Vulgatibacter incomptus TaxID=1391653 RepID=A0A0K1PBD7_9BACT|nr:hydroxymethylglutaryl-CoA lyase [Vulgatibacter incomptus]AKU90853.1 Hydroxymethylglutaryl-CoA lyase [Vulgatibacter incomptus]